MPRGGATCHQGYGSGIEYALRSLVISLIPIAIWGCSTAPPKSETGWIGYKETGLASFYADKHQFKKTASGALYDHNVNTAAHRTIPFGSRLKVTNLENGKSVVVAVNDRGPFVYGRIVDLSKSAFSRIGNTSLGLIDVQIEVIQQD